jgi:hypothetical protein
MRAKTVVYRPVSTPEAAWLMQVAEVEQAWAMWHPEISVAPIRAAAQGAA